MATRIQSIVDRAARTDPAYSKGTANLKLLSRGSGGMQEDDEFPGAYGGRPSRRIGDARQLAQANDPSYMPLPIIGAASRQQNPNNVPGLMRSPGGGRTLVQTNRPSGGVQRAPGSGGMIQRGGQTTLVGGSTPDDFTGFASTDSRPNISTRVPPLTTAPQPTATTVAAPQSEAANPLSGDTNSAPTGAVQALPAQGVNAAARAGFSSRGMMTPRGTDVVPGASFTGGSGAYARQFTNGASASVYQDYIRKIFSPTQSAPGTSPLMRAYV